MEQPVIVFPVLMPVPKGFDCRFHQFEHFVALVDALGMVLHPAGRQISAGQIDRLQKIFNATAVFNLEFGPHLLYRQLP